MTRSLSVLLAAALLGVVPAGCAKEETKPGDVGKKVVYGKLLDNGKPFVFDAAAVKLPPGATKPPPGVASESLLQITFTPAEGGEAITARTSADSGTFEVIGADGKGIKPGRYRVTVVASFGFGPGAGDALKGRFAPGKSQLVVDVKPNEEVEIDVGKAK